MGGNSGQTNMKNKQIYLLIGQKGSGKSFIGSMFEKYFSIDFVRVENWLLGVKKDRDLFDEKYLEESFQTIENGVRQALKKTEILVFESTGLTEYFDSMLSNLKPDYNITTIKVKADSKICLKRVLSRDQSIHINISDKEVEEINSSVLQKNINTDYIIDNNNKSIDDLKEEIRRIIENTAHWKM